MPDYSNTKLYKIFCLDLSVKDFYIGHTTNMKIREINHRANTNENHCKSNLKLYAFIRENGGWENWHMEEIETFSCNNRREAEEYEDKKIQELQPTLNSQRRAYLTEEEKRQKKNEWKRNSISHHEYSRQYNKNMTQEQRDRKNARARELRALKKTKHD